VDAGFAADAGRPADAAASDADTADAAAMADASESTDASQVDSGVVVTSTLTVLVVRPDDIVISGATVELAGRAQTTGEDGAATFGDLLPGEVAVEVVADGFSTGAASVSLQGGVSAQLAVVIAPFADPIPFGAATGARIELSPIAITLPANALVDATGQVVTGTASVSIAVLSADQADAIARPAPFESIGGAEIRFSMDGAPLQLAMNVGATVEYVLPTSLDAHHTVGASLDAWFWDSSAGQWVMDGGGMIQTSTFEAPRKAWVGELDHFTQWSFGAVIGSTGCVRATVRAFGSGNAVGGARVRVEQIIEPGPGSSFLWVRYATTNSDGEVCVAAPDDHRYQVSAHHPSLPSLIGGPAIVHVGGGNSACTDTPDGCANASLELAGAGCVEGEIVGNLGDPIPRVSAHVSSGPPGSHNVVRVVSDANGRYCAPVAQTTTATIRIARNMTVFAASASIGSGSTTCGGTCVQAPPITLPPVTLHCATGVALLDDDSGNPPRPVAAGAVVYYYADEPTVSCLAGADDPATWGVLLATTTTGPGGRFCVGSAPITGSEYVVVSPCAAPFTPTANGYSCAPSGGINDKDPVIGVCPETCADMGELEGFAHCPF